MRLNLKTALIFSVVIGLTATAFYFYKTTAEHEKLTNVTASNLETTTPRCPTPETFSEDFNNFSIELLDANPSYAEKEQRYYWQKHLEEMGCIEAEDILDNAICADCETNDL